MTTRRRGLPAAAMVVALTLALAACGSRLDPGEVRAAGAAAGGGRLTQGFVGGKPGAGAVTDAQASGAGVWAADATGTGAPGGARAGGRTSTGWTAVRGKAADGPDVKAGSCAGFRNQTGITNEKITIANVADISGPVPGIFESARDATRAFAAYFNATSAICGRKLEVLSLDSRTDAAADQEAYTKACANAFAAVGSMSAFDSGGASTAQRCGLPDIRSSAVTPERVRCSTCFGAQAVAVNLIPNSVPDFFVKRFPQAVKKTAMLTLNAQAAKVNADSAVAGYSKRGFNFVYQDTIDVSEFNYSPYVQEMKRRGVRCVRFFGDSFHAVRLAQAMQQQGFRPDVFIEDEAAYTPEYVDQGGDAVEGTYVFMNIVPFEEASSSKEMQLYEAWLQRVNPGATPDFFGLYAWSAARLFVERATALGGRLTRSRLVQRIRGVDHWTGHGLHSPQRVGAKRTSACFLVIRLEHKRWVQKSPGRYMCDGLTDTGVGG